MKNQIRTALTTLAFAGLFSGLMVRGEDMRTENANVPFSFRVSSAVMPAGMYSAIESNTPSVIRLQNRMTGKSVLISAPGSKSGKAAQSKLGFRCYDNRCFLAEIWFADETFGHALPTTARERELVASHDEPKLTYVAMR